jgi:hypothetical protein
MKIYLFGSFRQVQIMLAESISRTKIVPDAAGYINIPDKTGLGIEINTSSIKQYSVNTQIIINDKTIYHTPEL